MLRPFVSGFLLPLVRGGPLHVGRPLGLREVATLVEAWSLPPETGSTPSPPGEHERAASEQLRRLRGARARALLLTAPDPPIDEATIRLGAALHDLLVLSHPDLGDAREERARRRVAEAALALAEVGSPRTVVSAVHRHTLLARVPEIVLPEHVVSYWVGRRTYVGRRPPPRLTALPRLRRVRTEERRRVWVREVGVAALARPAWIALHRAHPLAEALDPLRVDPPLAWERVLPVLRFPAIARLAAGRVAEVGLAAGGNVYAAALLRYLSARPPGSTARPSPAEVVFALRFLAHLVWLDLLYAPTRPAADPAPGDLAALLAAAAEVEPRLIMPRDLAPTSDLARAFLTRLADWRAALLRDDPPRMEAALGVCRFATGTQVLALPDSPPDHPPTLANNG